MFGVVDIITNTCVENANNVHIVYQLNALLTNGKKANKAIHHSCFNAPAKVFN